MNAEAVPFVFAFSAGLVSFLSPCVLPLIPAYITYLTGVSVTGWKTGKAGVSRWLLLGRALAFVLGFSLVFVLMGASASLAGQWLLNNREAFRKASGLLIIVFGLHMTGLLKIKWFYREKRMEFVPRSQGTLSAVLMGMAFAAGWTPCVGPVLSSILLYAGTAETVGTGIYLLSVYSLGLAVPFLITALAINWFGRFRQRFNRLLPVVSVVGGVIMILFGVLIFTNQIQLIGGYFYF
ncbi:hypothetical protein SY88_19770 [Clostridiales bacterium PH28_bin88]|nr:hypothetical protein SY88_19770 [Clostridiales bacterium PH28_bin88]